MRFLIVNADDFGLSSGVNRAVIDGHTRGLITSATIMVNMPAFVQAARLAKAHPSLGVGLHFNITQRRPVADPALVRSLTDQAGEFLGTSTALAGRALLGRLNAEEVAIELRAQIEKALDAGLTLTHLDSHKHAHVLPQVFRAITETIKDYGIGAVRLPREKIDLRSRGLLSQSLTAFVLSRLSRLHEGRMRAHGIKTAGAFFGIRQTGFWTAAWLKDLIGRLPEGTSELMCHPGYRDQTLPVKTRLVGSRLTEIELLTSPEIISFVRGLGIKLINYSEVNRQD